MNAASQPAGAVKRCRTALLHLIPAEAEPQCITIRGVRLYSSGQAFQAEGFLNRPPSIARRESGMRKRLAERSTDSLTFD